MKKISECYTKVKNTNKLIKKKQHKYYFSFIEEGFYLSLSEEKVPFFDTMVRDKMKYIEILVSLFDDSRISTEKLYRPSNIMFFYKRKK